MSMEYCHKCDKVRDTDYDLDCPQCEDWEEEE